MDLEYKILVASAGLTLVGAVLRLVRRVYKGVKQWGLGIQALLEVMHDQQQGTPRTLRQDVDAVRDALTELQSVAHTHAAVVTQPSVTDGGPAPHP